MPCWESMARSCEDGNWTGGRGEFYMHSVLALANMKTETGISRRSSLAMAGTASLTAALAAKKTDH
jgi:hypothetical protein